MDYQLIRSQRKTISIQISGKGMVVKAPKKLPISEIEAVLQRHRRWIERRMAAISQKGESLPKLDSEEIARLKQQAKLLIPQRVAYYAERMGISYGRISIRCQKTRWGSCSAKGNLNFNCLLMLTPSEVLDSVVVHELCHRRFMNHSADFYREVRKYFPEYDKQHKWLKENGSVLLSRVIEDSEADM